MRIRSQRRLYVHSSKCIILEIFASASHFLIEPAHHTCCTISFNSKSFNQSAQAALNQNVRPTRYHRPNTRSLPLPQHARACRHSCACTDARARACVGHLVRFHPPAATHSSRLRNELIRQSDEGRATVRSYIPMPEDVRRDSMSMRSPICPNESNM